MRIEFDSKKDAIKKQKHGISLAMAEFLDWEMAIIEQDSRFEYGEVRFIGLSPLRCSPLYGGFYHPKPKYPSDQSTKVE